MWLVLWKMVRFTLKKEICLIERFKPYRDVINSTALDLDFYFVNLFIQDLYYKITVVCAKSNIVTFAWWKQQDDAYFMAVPNALGTYSKRAHSTEHIKAILTWGICVIVLLFHCENATTILVAQTASNVQCKSGFTSGSIERKKSWISNVAPISEYILRKLCARHSHINLKSTIDVTFLFSFFYLALYRISFIQFMPRFNSFIS